MSTRDAHARPKRCRVAGVSHGSVRALCQFSPHRIHFSHMESRVLYCAWSACAPGDGQTPGVPRSGLILHGRREGTRTCLMPPRAEAQWPPGHATPPNEKPLQLANSAPRRQQMTLSTLRYQIPGLTGMYVAEGGLLAYRLELHDRPVDGGRSAVRAEHVANECLTRQRGQVAVRGR
jgi:hypothetical protein